MNKERQKYSEIMLKYNVKWYYGEDGLKKFKEMLSRENLSKSDFMTSEELGGGTFRRSDYKSIMKELLKADKQKKEELKRNLEEINYVVERCLHYKDLNIVSNMKSLISECDLMNITDEHIEKGIKKYKRKYDK